MSSSRFVVGTHILVVLGAKKVMCGHFGKDDTVRSDELAFSVNTNPVVIRRILSMLQKEGLITTKAGRYGGSFLDRPADSITLRAVYEAVEEEGLFHEHYQGPNMQCPVGSCIIDVLSGPMKDAERAMMESLEKYTIADLVQGVFEEHRLNEKLQSGHTYEQIMEAFGEQGLTTLSAAR